jgi:hypothetical protein
MRLVGVSAARRHIRERYAGPSDVQRSTQTQDASQPPWPVPENRLAAPMQLPSAHPEVVGHTRDRGGRTRHRVHLPAERIDGFIGGAPRQPRGK